MGKSTVLDSGEVLKHHHHLFRKTDIACTQIKTGMAAYLGGVRTLRVDTVIILLHVTNFTSTLHKKKQTRPFHD